MAFYGEDQVRRVRQAIDIVQLISDYTPLRKAGAHYTGCCPFHQERTPSFYVYPDDGHYHCFGCQVHGDAFDFVKEKERLEFTEAIEWLAKRAGIVLVRQQDDGKHGQRQSLSRAVEFACTYYQRQLRESPGAAEARAYLERRRLGQAVVERFRVGWAPGSGQLAAEARRSGIDLDLFRQADLLVDRDGRLADRFWERITFPICDRFGAPIAFSARLLPAAEQAAKAAGRGVGKYINNTDTPLYHKGATVFNLHHARSAVRDRGRLIVMEGPTDVMAADQAGFPECVAVLGTALTPEHARQLGNLVGADGKLIVLLDGDRAGVANSLKATRTCLAAGVAVRISLLPDELDPAELLAEGTDPAAAKATFEGVLNSARSEIQHLLHLSAPRPHQLDPRALVTVIDDLIDAVRAVPDSDLRSLHLRDAAGYLGIAQDRLERRLHQAPAPSEPKNDRPASAEPPPPALDPQCEALLHILTREPGLRSLAADELAVEPSDLPAPWGAVLAALLFTEGDPAQADGVAGNSAVVRTIHQWQVTPLDRRVPAVGDPEARLRESAGNLARGRDERELARLRQAIADAEKASDRASIRRLGQDLMVLRARLGPG